MRTALAMISYTRSWDGLCSRWEKSKQAKSVCRPSSLDILLENPQDVHQYTKGIDKGETTNSSFEKVNPGMRPRFLSQNIEAKEPEKKMPSTAAKAIKRSAKVVRWSEIHRNAQSALRLMQGTVKDETWHQVSLFD